ncbi:nicotinate-nicotinamide nucleotide adenylyltransferase, partial [Spirulina subsalsa FACHB-351]
MKQKRGILGGTFDPIHQGHLTLAQVALTQGQLDQILWIPDGDAPHKAQKRRSPYVDRCSMVEQAIAPYPHFHLEIPPAHPTPHYSIHTFQHLQATYPPSEWYWIVGFDTFQTLPRWYQRHQLIPALQWLVAPRPPLPCHLQPIIEQLHDQGINI